MTSLTTAYFRIIRPGSTDGDTYGTFDTDNVSADDMHMMRHTLASQYGCSPMLVQIYNVFSHVSQSYWGTVETSTCNECTWDQEKYTAMREAAR